MPIIVSPGIANPAPPLTSTSPDGILKATADPVGGGVLLEAQFPGAVGSWPHEIIFERTDGARVRGGDPQRSPGGFGVSYDLEVPLGRASAWIAYPVPFHAPGTRETLGEPCQPVSLVAPTLPAGFNCWLKSINYPNLSMPLVLAGDPEIGFEGRLSMVNIPGSRFPGGSWDVRTSAPIDVTFETERGQWRQVVALLSSGPLLFQPDPAGDLDQMFCLAGQSRHPYLVGSHDPARNNTVSLTEIARPVTIDAPEFIPGRSYDDIAALVSTHDEATAVWPTHRDTWQV